MPDAESVGPVEPVEGRVLLPAVAEHAGHLMWRAAARVSEAIVEALPPGVDLHGYAVLLALAGRATRSQQELAEIVDVSRTTVSNLAGQLSGQGLVTRVRNPADRRSYLLTRTAEGAAAARRWRRHAEDVEDAITAGFDVEERDALRRLLARLVEDELSPLTPDALLDSVVFLVSRVHLRMHREFAAVLEPLGIEPRHFGVLTALESVGPVPQGELARDLGMSGPSMVQIADELEARGLVQRRRPESDRRTQELHLLPRAAVVRQQAAELARTAARPRLGVLSQDQRTQLVALLRAFVTAP